MQFSGLILAGGLSSRMGVDKTGLKIQNKTMLEWQIEKLQLAGASEILLCGIEHCTLPNVRCVADILPNRGPLGGIYSGLRAARFQKALTISADVPLLPVDTLNTLLLAHKTDATLLTHNGQVEPLIGVYEKSLTTTILPLIERHSASVWELLDRCDWKTSEFVGDERRLFNCNTPDEFSAVLQFANELYPTIS